VQSPTGPHSCLILALLYSPHRWYISCQPTTPQSRAPTSDLRPPTAGSHCTVLCDPTLRPVEQNSPARLSVPPSLHRAAFHRAVPNRTPPPPQRNHYKERILKKKKNLERKKRKKVSSLCGNSNNKTNTDTMAMSVIYCHHSFKIIKSETTLLLWNCGMCGSGPHWFIFECKYCKLKTCRPCAHTA